MTLADDVVSHISSYWNPAILKPKVLNLLTSPLEKTLGESVLVEMISARWEPINESYANQHADLLIRIYTNKTVSRLKEISDEVDRIFGDYVVNGWDINIAAVSTDVSSRQGQTYCQVIQLQVSRFGVVRGVPYTSSAPVGWQDPTFVTIDDETAVFPNSVRHQDILEGNRHPPKIHDIGSDRHTFALPVTLENDLTVQGDLTVEGTQTAVESIVTQIKDNVITLNKGETGTGITLGLGGIELDRGSLSYAQILFDEANDRFVLRYGDATKIPLELDSILTPDADRANYLGKTRIGMPTSLVNYAAFSHRSLADAIGNYALLQDASGDTFLNAASGKAINVRNNNYGICSFDATGQKWGSFYVTSAFLVADNKVADSDKLDSYHAANSASSIPILDASALLPTAQVPPIAPSKLSAVDSPNDQEVPVYNSSQQKFEWKPTPTVNLLLSTIDVDSNTTYVEWTGLDINTHRRYRITAHIKEGSGVAGYYYIYFNGDTTNTNYYREQVSGDSTTVTGGRANDPMISYINASTRSLIEVTVGITDGYPCYLARVYRGSNTISPITDMISGNKTATVANMTSIRITAGQTNGIAAGSKFELEAIY